MFESVARLLLPDDESGAGVVKSDERWRLDSTVPTDAAAVVWGREPTTCGGGAVRLAWNAARRERALASLRCRPPRPLRVGSVYRWEPTVFYRSRLSGLRSAAAAGVLVELGRGATHERLLDSAARAAGARAPVTSFRPGTDGSLLAPIAAADGRRLILRAGEAGTPADPHRGAAALERLAPLWLATVPRPEGRGRVGHAAWTAETHLGGKRPWTVGPQLAMQAANLCLSLPPATGSPTAFEHDLEAIAARLPGLRDRLSCVRETINPRMSALPAAMRHGDLWAGNLLVDRGVLRGVVDWDSWHPAAVPGADLLHLLGMQEAVRRGRSLGELWLEAPWEGRAFRELTAGYWAVLGLRPDREIREAVGWAWWANQMACSLTRLPQLASDGNWLRRNVDLVVATLEGEAPCGS